MPGVNGIQSTPSFTSLQPQATFGGGTERNIEVQNAGLAVDTYSGGSEPWRNKATAAGGQAACRCGNCSACAIQAYVAQGQRIDGEDQADLDESAPAQKQDGAKQEEKPTTVSGSKGVDGEVLSQQEQARLAELKKVDRAVRAHEQAHLAAAGSLVRRGVLLSYEKGPDGSRYAVSGEVSIDTSKAADPADTVSKMRTVRAAALAPAEPSAQDRKVAAAATVTMNAAMHELNLARAAEENGENVVGQAAERMAGGNIDDMEPQDGTPGESGIVQSDVVSPLGSRSIQRYTASGSTHPQRLAVIA